MSRPAFVCAVLAAFATPPAAGQPTPADPNGDPLPAGAVVRLGTTRLRPGGSVEHMAFSPDGTRLASWSGDTSNPAALSLWDTKTGAAVRRVELPQSRADLLVWLADGRGIAVVRPRYDDPDPVVWEFTDETAPVPPTRLRQHEGGNVPGPNDDVEFDSCYAISPDGKTIAVGKAGRLTRDREVRLCELKVGTKVGDLKRIKEVATHPGNCWRLRFTPDGKALVVFATPKNFGADKGEVGLVVTVWDVATAKEVTRFTAPRPATNGQRAAVALSNTLLAVGLQGGDTSLWDLATGKERKLATGHLTKYPRRGGATAGVAFTPDGKTLATCGVDGATINRDEVAKVWDVASGKFLRALPRQHGGAGVVTFAPDGKTLASAGAIIRLWDTATGKDALPLPGHQSDIVHAAMIPDGRTAITAGGDKTLRWWDIATGAETRLLAVAADVRGLTLTPDGKTAIVATGDGKLRTWDATTGRETTAADLPEILKPGDLCFTPDGRHLVAAAGPRVQVWAWPGMKLVRTIELPKPVRTPGESRCDAVAVSPDGKWLVTVVWRTWPGAQSDPVADVWNFATGKPVRRLVGGPYAGFQSGEFTSDGRFLLVGGGGTIPAHDGLEDYHFKGELNLLDPVAGRWVRGFETPSPTGKVSYHYTGATALSPDGRTVYVSYNTGEVIAFEVATGKLRRKLAGHRGAISALAFGAAGRLISGGSDGTAVVWERPFAVLPRRDPLPEADAVALWAKVGSDDPGAAFGAMRELAAAPDRAVELVRKNVPPAPAAPTDAALDRLFRELGDDDFLTREKASKKLAGYGEAAVPAVRKRLETDIGPEARRRAVAFLKAFDRPAPSPARVKQTRAVELLEGVGTVAARKLLGEFANGGPGAPLTLDAAAALKRLGP